MDSNGIEVPDYLCPVCAVDFLTLREFEDHRSTPDHRVKYLDKVYSTGRLQYLKDKFGISIEILNESPGIKHKADDYTIEVAAEIDCPEDTPNDNEQNGLASSGAINNGLASFGVVKNGLASSNAEINGVASSDDDENGPISAFTENDCTLSFTFRLHNKGIEAYHMMGIDLLKTNSLIENETFITIEDSLKMSERLQIIIFRPAKCYDVVCKIKPGNISRVLHIPLLFEFQTIRRDRDKIELQQSIETFYVGRTLEIKGIIFSVRDFGNFVPGVYPGSENHHLNDLEKELSLKPYHIPAWFQTLAYNNKPIDIWRRMRISPVVTFKSYKNFFRTLLWLEELQEELDIQFYRKKEITLHFPKTDFFTGLKLVEYVDPGLAESRPCLMKRDKVFVCSSEEAKITDKPQWYEGIVHQVKNTSVCLGFHQNRFIPNFDSKTKFNLEFTINRYNFQVCHRAVDLCTRDYFRDILFPIEERKPGNKKPESKEHLPDLLFYDPNIGNNYEQMQAIQHIVCGVRRSSPYIIFGPPGTGKTVTIVEAIKQILYMVPGSYVMACAPSNSAADVIAERLLDHFTGDHVFRMYSESRTKFLKDLPEKLLKASNYLKEKEKVYFPAKEELMTKRVIVCTFIAAAKIAAAKFPEGHFTHVILDEAGHATECEALVGVGGILSPEGKLILAGDPHQLGPMVRNLQAVSKGHIFKETGLDTSLLERIMNIPMYSNQRNGYDAKYVTKLVKNYRSHHTILKVPNELFYNSELQAKGSAFLVDEYVNWRHLPRRGFPIIVHSVAGEDRTEAHSPSYHNPEEVREVMSYLKKLLDEEAKPEDIGIITPYRLQVEKLRNELRRINVKVKVGSVEDFQGEERKIIIISTVRASKRHLAKDDLFKLGFLRNPKRFNVAITRAQCLLILVCCSDVLLLDRNWRRLIDYARAKGGYRGEPYRAPKEGLDELIKRMGALDIRPNVGDISTKQIVEVPSWERNT